MKVMVYYSELNVMCPKCNKSDNVYLSSEKHKDIFKYYVICFDCMNESQSHTFKEIAIEEFQQGYVK